MNHPKNQSRQRQFFHGARVVLKPGDLIEALLKEEVAKSKPTSQKPERVFLSENLDEAIWDAELAQGDTPPSVYIVEPLGEVRAASEIKNREAPAHPSMSYYCDAPLRVIAEYTDWTLYHGTRAALEPGQLLTPGYTSNFGSKTKKSNYIYFARTLDAAIWGAELSAGEGAERIYVIEATGEIEDDPNVTDKKFRGNPTKSFRSRDPLRIIKEVKSWQGHAPERLKTMKDNIERLARQGIEPIDD